MTDRGRRDITGDDFAKTPDKSNREKIREEINAAAKKGVLGPAIIADLYNKYGDQEALLEEELRLRAKKAAKIKKRAHKVAKKIYEKYNDGSRPLHEILDRMMRYKAENKWSDFEFDEFRKELSNLLTGNRASEIDYNQNIEINRSRINKVLGNNRIVEYGRGLQIKETEGNILNEILSMYETSAPLHSTIRMHSMMYEDCSLVAMTGEYKRDRHIASNYIHPLLACLYLPKFDLMEIHTLYANFGSIIKARHEKRPIETEPDYLLFEEITSDPNDVVCEINSPITDLRNRFRVQIALWRTILNLRNGRYYEDEPVSSFIALLNGCRNNLYDDADLIYMQDEGALLRRFFSVFSLRPTLIFTKPLSSVSLYMAGPMKMDVNPGFGTGLIPNTYPFNNQPTYTITHVPMITLQLPPAYTEGEEPKDLRDSIFQTIWINENRTIVPKERSIINSKELLIFYVNRRIQRIQIRTFSNPISFSQLPLTMSNIGALNKYPVNVPQAITLGRSNETYLLRSVVTVDETEIRQGDKSTYMITGCSGLIMSQRNISQNIYSPSYYLYDPLGASLPVQHPEGGGFITNKPISLVEPFFYPPDPLTGVSRNKSFFEKASYTGTIYIYAKSTGYDPREMITL